MDRLVSALGVLVMMALSVVLRPKDRRRSINPRTILGGLTILFVLAVLVLKTPVRALFTGLSHVIDVLLTFSARGTEFVFGDLVSNKTSFGVIFAFHVLPTILFFGALTSVLYHLGVIPYVVGKLSAVMARALRTSGAETFSGVAGVFVGMTEAPLAVRPYVPRLTQSELAACMVAGFATTAGGVLAAYVVMLKDFVPGIAGHLIASSVMGAPASLIVAKLMMPETETPETLGARTAPPERTTTNVVDALASGTMDGLRLAVNVAAMLIVFLAFTAMIDAGLAFVGDQAEFALSLDRIFGWLFFPIAWVIGVPSEDVPKLAALLGQKTALNEFVAYASMSRNLGADPGWLTERGQTLAAYALCGFANFGSIGIQLGGYSGIAPERRPDLSRLALRTMFGGFLATNLVACVAGILL